MKPVPASTAGIMKEFMLKPPRKLRVTIIYLFIYLIFIRR
jgi:hypothetical protein